MTSQVQPDYGHHWTEKDRVQEYVERTDQEDAERRQRFSLVAKLLPDTNKTLRILDIGSGHGPFAAALLDALPNASAVGLDLSEAMIDVGRERMARFGSRFQYHVGDFAEGHLPQDLPGTFDVAVAASAIHHLPPDRKRTLYREVYGVLNQGGAFFNMDNMQPKDEFLRDLYRSARGRVQRTPEEEAARAASPHGSLGHWMDPAEDHMAFLREAGFQHVECFLKQLSLCLVGGYKL